MGAETGWRSEWSFAMGGGESVSNSSLAISFDGNHKDSPNSPTVSKNRDGFGFDFYRRKLSHLRLLHPIHPFRKLPAKLAVTPEQSILW